MITTITLIGADARFSASIEQLLKLKTNGRFALGDHGDITLVDADSIEGKHAIDQHLDDCTIILTVSPENFEHDFIIRKPIKVEELLKVLNSMASSPKKVTVKAKEESVASKKVSDSIGNPFAKFMDPEYLAKRKQQKSAEDTIAIQQDSITAAKVINQDHLLSTETAFTYWHELLKEIKKITAYTHNDEYFSKIEKTQLHEMSSIYSQTEDIYYDMSTYASLQIFKKVYHHQLDNQLNYFELSNGIVIFFGDGVIISNLSVEDILSFSEMSQENVRLQRINSKEFLMELINRYDRYYYTNALNAMARAILLAAKGRIINGQDIKEPLGLMRKKETYDNTIKIPYAKELDNIWGFRNVSLRDTAELLPEVNLYYIFSYYTLCDLYGFFDNELVDNKSKNQLDLNALLSELQKL